MRFFLFLFLSLYIESNITERDDVKEFIKFAISNSDLDRDEVLAFIKDAKPSKKAVVLKNNQPEVKATWDSYRNTRVSATRIINGLKNRNLNCIKLKSNQWVDLSDNVRIKSFSDWNQDSCLLIEISKKDILLF